MTMGVEEEGVKTRAEMSYEGSMTRLVMWVIFANFIIWAAILSSKLTDICKAVNSLKGTATVTKEIQK